MADLRIGTSGWSYPSGPGTWNGIFYPAGRPRGRRFDELAYYAEHFNTVEVNTSFYRVPDPGRTRAWAQRTPKGFDFSLKLFQKFTHAAMYRKSLDDPGGPTGPTSGPAGPPPLPEVTQADVDLMRQAIDPLASAGKLGALLAQFPPSFHDSPEARDYLTWLLGEFRDYPMAIELRHRTWSDRAAATLDLLGSHRAAWVQIDEPKFRFSIRQNHLPNLRGLYYMRLHGRNAEKWWTHDHPDERYNYLYSPLETAGVADTIATVRRLVQRIYVYLNNHFAAKAVANAAALKHDLGEKVPGTFSEEMLQRYAFLRSFVEAEPRADAGLFFGEPDEEGLPAGGAESPEE